MIKRVAVVILNWNGLDYLKKFLPTVLKHNIDYSEIYLADNNSTDDSVAFVQGNYPQIKIIKNEINSGFAQGYNDALLNIKAEYYVLLNSDVRVTDDWINPIITMMDKDTSIAACQPKIRSFNQPDYFEYAGAGGGFIDNLGFPFCRGRIFDTIEKDDGQYDDVKEVFWASGACLFVRSELFHKVNGFDGDFFAHMEEIDLCWRLKNLGYKIMYCPYSVVFHVGGGTLQYLNPKKTYLNFRNNLYLLFKNLPLKQLFQKIFIRMLFDGIAAIRFLVKGEVKHFNAVLKAHLDFYLSFNNLIAKRRKKIKRNDFQQVYRGSIVFQYFARKRKVFSKLNFK